MPKYHISKNGKIALCNAKNKPCPLSDIHVEANSQEEAQNLIEQELSKKYSVLPKKEHKEVDINTQKEIALTIAMTAHEGQYDTTDVVPYILHPVAVASNFQDKKLYCVAMMHDVLEDTDITSDNLLEQGFSPDIVEAVVSMTRLSKDEPYEDYMNRLIKNPMAVEVKIADIKHNMDKDRQLLLDFYKPKEKDKRYREKKQKQYKDALEKLEMINLENKNNGLTPFTIEEITQEYQTKIDK